MTSSSGRTCGRELVDFDLLVSVGPDGRSFDGHLVVSSQGIRGREPHIRVVSHAFDLAAVGVGPHKEHVILYHEPDRRRKSLSVLLEGFKPDVIKVPNC